MSADNYKRATFIVEDSKTIDVDIEGKGPLNLTTEDYRLMSIAANEMLNGHAASCWQDYIPDQGYVRVVKRKHLCKNKCTRKGMQAVREVKEVRRIPMIERPRFTIPTSIFNIFTRPRGLKV